MRNFITSIVPFVVALKMPLPVGNLFVSNVSSISSVNASAALV